MDQSIEGEGAPVTMNRWRIRRAQLADAVELAACIDAAYAQYNNRISDLPPVSDGCGEEISKNQVWVAVEYGRIIGGLFLVPQGEVMKLANVAVHPDYAGKGLGSELIAFGERQAKNQGFGEMRLNTHVEMAQNVALYTTLGWEEVCRRANTVSMRKFLKPLQKAKNN
jgi:GNAT superfamily N-acetyltransferase